MILFDRRKVFDGERYLTGLDSNVFGGPARIEPSSHGLDLDNLSLSRGCLVRLPGSDTKRQFQHERA